MGKRLILILFVLLLAIFFYAKSSQTPEPPSAVVFSEISFHPNPILLKILKGKALPEPLFSLENPGSDRPVDYSRYGTFKNLNKNSYQYILNDKKGLQQAVGAGIYPNQAGILDDKTYQYYESLNLIDSFHWDSLTFDDWQRAFYIWTQAPEEKGVKSFFTAECLENAGLIMQAIKAYHATLVHFPRSACWGKDQSFVWYVGQAALDNIYRLCREYPDLNLSLENAYFKVTNGEDTDLTNDIIEVNPGYFIDKNPEQKIADLPDLNQLKITEQRGEGRVQLHKYENGHWMLSVDHEPFYIHGMTYNPTKVGHGPRINPYFMAEWMFSDLNKNQKIDAPYDSWIDKNKNGKKDKADPIVGDFQLMKDIGINAIRIYPENKPSTQYNPKLLNKKLLRDMYESFDIMVIVGDFLGAYTIGSGASWEDGTDYRDIEQKRLMKQAVHDKVSDLKDEPFVLMWLLGNENNLPINYMGTNATRTNAAKYPIEYAKFLNEVAKMIHVIDGNHPVAVGNIELKMLDIYKEYAPEIDIIGINSYRGSVGFGDLWVKTQETIDRPVLITEFGCDAYEQAMGENQEAQKMYHQGKWEDIILNEAGGELSGIALGGVIFEFLDEWWKDTSGDPEYNHQTEAQMPLEMPDGFDHEEWYGIISQGNGVNSPFQREPREAYYYYQNLQK